eukprot:c935_g1_i1.p1 GENE.c935_g1_i1~~c935_g1_i1.p1  ORF type:complete len:343 (+),score=81.67 c935_g1_i1:27-1031(+)
MASTKDHTAAWADGSESKRSFVKYVSLVTLVVQNTALVLLLRYSRTVEGPKYLSSTAVTMMEIVKLIACVIVVFFQSGSSFSATYLVLKQEIWDNPHELAKVSIPSLIYTIQNNLLYLALSNLNAVIYQVCYQLKILTTALFSVVMLGKHLSWIKWLALLVLTCGVAVVQTSTVTTPSTTESSFVGFVAVLLACLTSGFSGVYFERILKGSNTTLWVRNIQMGVTSVLLSFINVYSTDREAVLRDGFFYGYSWVVIGVILLQALGGLTVAVVVKYADNILKGFAASYSIVASLLLDMVLFSFWPSGQFMMGALLVNVATVMYAQPDPKPRLLPL